MAEAAAAVSVNESMLLFINTSCAVGSEGRNWPRLSSALGHWSPGGVVLVLHQGRFAAVCTIYLAGNTLNDNDYYQSGWSLLCKLHVRCLYSLFRTTIGNVQLILWAPAPVMPHGISAWPDDLHTQWPVLLQYCCDQRLPCAVSTKLFSATLFLQPGHQPPHTQPHKSHRTL